MSVGAGAYKADLTAQGQATFKIDSKYNKGQKTLTGTTDFSFKTLVFKSTSYDSLAVTGASANGCATIKGRGLINGVDHQFMLTACDKVKDTLRIKIWKGNDPPVYDNTGCAPADTCANVVSGSVVVKPGRRMLF
jgi:hypothetical protein